MKYKFSLVLVSAAAFASCKSKNNNAQLKSICSADAIPVTYDMNPNNPDFLGPLANGNTTTFQGQPAVWGVLPGEVVGKSQGTIINPDGYDPIIDASVDIGIAKQTQTECRDEPVFLTANPRPHTRPFCSQVPVRGCGSAAIQIYAGDVLVQESAPSTYCGEGREAFPRINLRVNPYNLALGNKNIHVRVVHKGGPVHVFVTRMEIQSTTKLSPNCE